MTEENYNYRTSQTLLRNQFPGKGKWKIPVIPKFQPKDGDFNDLLLIGFDKTNLEDQNHLDRMVHFFLYDYRFERVWKNPEADIEKLSRYRAVLSPDFSMYLEMAPVMQMYNVFRNRWCGAYWASKGIRVIPTVNWGDESTFDFCFDGIEKGSVVAVSTYMASEHDHRKDQKEWFMAGYNEMLRRIEPEKIICYNTPFPQMQGDIVHVDYERSSWRYMDYDRKAISHKDLDCYKIGGANHTFCDTMDAYMIGKGGGSAYGGDWKPNPNKPNEVILQGPPDSIQQYFLPFKNGGYWVKVKYGEDGWAVRIRHETKHNPNQDHTNPHDHNIDYDPSHRPIYVKPQINYPADQYPDGAPEFKSFPKEVISKMFFQYNEEEMRFKTISEFKSSLLRGGEIVIEWNKQLYGFFYNGTAFYITFPDGKKSYYETSDEVLERYIGNDRLRDIITQATVLDRAL
jgi:hypothetical protein